MYWAAGKPFDNCDGLHELLSAFGFESNNSGFMVF
jgi:hypothetical protein